MFRRILDQNVLPDGLTSASDISEFHLTDMLFALQSDRRKELGIYASLEAQYARLKSRLHAINAGAILSEGTNTAVLRTVRTCRILLVGLFSVAVMVPLLLAFFSPFSMVDPHIRPIMIDPIMIAAILGSLTFSGASIMVLGKIWTMNTPSALAVDHEKESFAIQRARLKWIIAAGISGQWVLVYSVSELVLPTILILPYSLSAALILTLVSVLGGFVNSILLRHRPRLERTLKARKIETRMAQIEVNLHKRAIQERNAFELACLKTWSNLRSSTASHAARDTTDATLPFDGFRAFKREASRRYVRNDLLSPSLETKELVQPEISVIEMLPTYSGDGSGTPTSDLS